LIKSDKEKFRKSFAGATIHDMFNLLSVLVLLPLELIFNYLERVSGALVAPLSAHSNSTRGKEPELLGAITKALVDAVIQIDKRVLDSMSSNASYEADSLIKRVCKVQINETVVAHKKCPFLFAQVDWPDWVIGSILLVVSLVLLSSCLIGMVKILSSIFKGPVAHIIQKVVNSDLPGVFRYFTGFIVISVFIVRFYYHL
jgi:sodium-dependent phosphate cotransporter